MEWLHPLSFPWLKQELTSAFWRQTPLYLGIDSTVELWMLFSKNPETEAFHLIGWLVQMGFSDFQVSKLFYSLLRQHGLSSKYHLPRKWCPLGLQVQVLFGWYHHAFCHHDPIRMIFFQHRHSWIWSNIAGWTLLAAKLKLVYPLHCYTAAGERGDFPRSQRQLFAFRAPVTYQSHRQHLARPGQCNGMDKGSAFEFCQHLGLVCSMTSCIYVDDIVSMYRIIHAFPTGYDNASFLPQTLPVLVYCLAGVAINKSLVRRLRLRSL